MKCGVLWVKSKQHWILQAINHHSGKVLAHVFGRHKEGAKKMGN